MSTSMSTKKQDRFAVFPEGIGADRKPCRHCPPTVWQMQARGRLSGNAGCAALADMPRFLRHLTSLGGGDSLPAIRSKAIWKAASMSA